MTLEKNLCISQDGELSTGPGLATNGVPEPVQENQSSCSYTDDTSEGEIEGEQENLALDVCPSQDEEELAEVGKGWEEVETQGGEEEREQGLLCEEAEEAELACSMQYDEEELEQLNMMVYLVGDEMSTLLSPPSQGQSPARCRGTGGSSGASSTDTSPRRLLVGRGRTGNTTEEEDRVFFMEDLDAAGDHVTSISREACGLVDSSVKGTGSARPVQRRLEPRSDSVRNGWYSENPSDQPCTQPRGQNPLCHHVKLPTCTAAPGAEPLPYTNGWDTALEGTATETAEVIAHRMGGMKLSATVIFNPRSPSLTELAVDKLLLPRPAPSEAEPCSPLVATHCLLNSCVCCGSCEDGHDDPVPAETNGLGLGLALGLDKFSKTTSAVIQSSACRFPPRGHEPHGKGELTRVTPPSSHSSTEPPEEDSNSQLCEKCLVFAPGPGNPAQDSSSGRGDGSSLANQQQRTGIKRQASGGQKVKENEKDKSGAKEKRDAKEETRRRSRCVVLR